MGAVTSFHKNQSCILSTVTEFWGLLQEHYTAHRFSPGEALEDLRKIKHLWKLCQKQYTEPFFHWREGRWFIRKGMNTQKLLGWRHSRPTQGEKVTNWWSHSANYLEASTALLSPKQICMNTKHVYFFYKNRHKPKGSLNWLCKPSCRNTQRLAEHAL